MSALYTALLEGETKESLAAMVCELRMLLREARECGPINPYNETADLAERIDAALSKPPR